MRNDVNRAVKPNAKLPSALGFFIILLRLRLRRFFNSAHIKSARLKTRVLHREAKTKGPSVWLTLIMATGLILTVLSAHYRTQERLDARFIRQQTEADLEHQLQTENYSPNQERGSATEDPMTAGKRSPGDNASSEIVIPLPPAPGFQVPHLYLEAMSAFLILMALSGLFLTLGLSDLAKPEWDLEWLSTFPIHRSVLLGSRVIERTFFNPVIQLALVPPIAMLIWKSGSSIAIAFPTAWLLTLPLMLLLANLQTVCDTGLRMHRGPAFLKNLQSVFNLAGLIPIYLLLFNGYGLPKVFLWLCKLAGEASSNTPIGFLVEAILTSGNKGLPLRPYLIECVSLSVLGFGFLIWQSRDGFEMNGGSGNTRSRAPITTKNHGKTLSDQYVTPLAMSAKARQNSRIRSSSGASRFSFRDRLSPLILREWRMLTRDTTYLTQTLLVPVLIIGIQVSNMLGSRGAAALNSAQLCAIAFGLASYSLLFTSVQSLTSEGPALWIIQAIPDGIKLLLKAKVRNWTALAFAMAASLVVMGEIVQPRWDLITVGRMGLVMVGIPVFALIATSFGVFSFTGTSTENVKRGILKLKPAYIYFYMLLAALYGSCFYIQTIYPVFVIAVLMIFVAIGIWQSAMREIPFIMDNSSSPPVEIRTVHGVVGVLLFFATEVLTLLSLEPWLRSDPRASIAAVVVTSSLIAGASVAVLGLALFYYRHGLFLKWIQSFRLKSSQRWVHLLDGVWGGVGALMFAGLFLWAEPMMGVWGKEGAKHAEIALFQNSPPIWASLGFIFLLPILYELLFTGLVLRTLRSRSENREMERLPEPILIFNSALLFALVQPELSFLPLLCIGAISGFLYLRTRSLLPGLIAHLIFNAGMILLLPNLIGSFGS